jgi:hypothetical protein
MVLLMKNIVSEFVPGCDHTVVRLDEALAVLIARRVIASQAVRLADESVAELRYWDASPICVGSPDPKTEESIEEVLDSGDGWAVLEDDALGSFVPGETDCSRMVVSAGDPPSVAWSYRAGSEPVRTCDVPLDALSRRLGKPLGNALNAVT